MSVLAYFTHHFDPVLLHIRGDFGIRYYGVAYILGFLSGVALLQWYWRRKRSPLNPEAVWDLIIAIIVGVMVGGRVGYFLLYKPEALLESPLTLFKVWEGGMASHGGMLGVGVAVALYARSKKIPFPELGDLIVTTAPAGLFFGRLANFINGELWGNPTTVPWGVYFPGDVHPPFPRHPSQLYEAALEGVLLFILAQWRFWKTDVTRQHPGQLSGEFLLAYAAVRAFGEQFREPDADLILGMSRGTFYSLFLIAAGIGFIAYSRRKTVTT